VSWCVHLSVCMHACECASVRVSVCACTSVRAPQCVHACVWVCVSGHSVWGVGCGVQGMEWNGGWVRYCLTMTESAAATIKESAKVKKELAGFALKEAESWPYLNLQQNMKPLRTG